MMGRGCSCRGHFEKNFIEERQRKVWKAWRNFRCLVLKSPRSEPFVEMLRWTEEERRWAREKERERQDSRLEGAERKEQEPTPTEENNYNSS